MHDELTKNLEEFILHGGIYGNIENQVAVNKAKSGGKSSGLAKKIFLSYDQLKFIYPVLQKHKWLTPFFEVVRWFRIVFRGRSKILAKELKANKKITFFLIIFFLLGILTGIFTAIRYAKGQSLIAFNDFSLSQYLAGDLGTSDLFFNRLISNTIVTIIITIMIIIIK